MALTDQEQEELTKQVEERLKARRQVGGVQSIPLMAKLIIFVVIGVLLYYILPNTMTSQTKLALIVIAAIILMIIFSSNPAQRRMLAEQEVVNLAYKHLLWKQRHPLGNEYQIPPGTIKVDLKGNLVWKEWGGEPYFWEHLVTIMSTDNYEKTYYVIKQDPFIDQVYGVYECPEGYMGRENPPRIIVTSSDFRKEMYIRQRMEESKRGML